jgi:hypothetical protein
MTGPGSSEPDDERILRRDIKRRRDERIKAAMAAVGLVIVLLGLSITLSVYEGIELPYRSGHAGIAGTIGPVECRQVGSGRRQRTVCSADFTPTDGSAVTTGIQVENGKDGQAARTPARLHSDGHTVSIVGTAPVAHTTALFGVALLLLEVAIWYLAASIRGRMRDSGRDLRRRRAFPVTVVAATALAVVVAFFISQGS